MNPDVKLEQVRGSFCLEIVGESVAQIAQSYSRSLEDDPVQVSRHVAKRRELLRVPQTPEHADPSCTPFNIDQGNIGERLPGAGVLSHEGQ